MEMLLASRPLRLLAVGFVSLLLPLAGAAGTVLSGSSPSVSVGLEELCIRRRRRGPGAQYFGPSGTARWSKRISQHSRPPLSTSVIKATIKHLIRVRLCPSVQSVLSLVNSRSSRASERDLNRKVLDVELALDLWPRTNKNKGVSKHCSVRACVSRSHLAAPPTSRYPPVSPLGIRAPPAGHPDDSYVGLSTAPGRAAPEAAGLVSWWIRHL
jgi:hypothetical protein